MSLREALFLLYYNLRRLLDAESSRKTLPSTVHIFEDGVPGSFGELTVGAVQNPNFDEEDMGELELGPPSRPPTRKRTKLDLVHAMFAPRRMSGLRVTRGSSDTVFKGERKNFISWWKQEHRHRVFKVKAHSLEGPAPCDFWPGAPLR